MEMQRFLQCEAYEEQECGMSATYLRLDDSQEHILAYLSLCNDAISLEVQEREDAGITYGSAPALKIARLAVDASVMRRGIGKELIEFAAYQAQLIREHSGIFFLTLDCYAHRVSFYESIGFVRNLIQPVVLPYDTPISMRIGLDAYLETIAL
jgi:GNAT superfamily N-acetyltransferase